MRLCAVEFAQAKIKRCTVNGPLRKLILTARELRSDHTPPTLFTKPSAVFDLDCSFHAGRVPQRIILIDGTELARLMIQYGVGVRTERTVELKRLDLAYFEDADD